MPTVIFAQLPTWVENTSKECRSTQLCAVGMGTSVNTASADARANLAKIFQTKVYSKFTSVISSDSKNDEMNSSLENQETVEGDLSGVEIAKVHATADAVYALAVLSKTKLAEETKQKIETLDKESKELINDNTLRSARVLEKNYEARRPLEEKYLFLTKQKVPEVISFAKIKAALDAALKGILICLVVETVEFDEKKFEQMIHSALTKNKYKVAKNSNAKCSHTLVGKASLSKEYLKVDGFEKYSLNVSLSSVDKDEKSSGSIELKSVVSGRDQKQIVQKINAELLALLEQDILKLNFD